MDRGYTGHEHLLGVGLIHMNGRLYDPLLHRFLAPDNYVQDPYNTQNYNRYGYVLNNPLKYTDPSGERARGEGGGVFGWILAGLISIGRAIFGGGGNSAATQAPTIDPSQVGVLNPNSSANVASPSGTVIRDGGFNINVPYGVFQSYFGGVRSGFSQFWSDFGTEFREGWNDPWGKWKQNVIERGAWKNSIPGYTAYQMTVGSQVHNFQVAQSGISDFYNGNYYDAGQTFGYYQGEKSLELGLMAVTAGVARGVSARGAIPAKGSSTVFRSFTKGNFRTNLGKSTGKIPSNSQAHHVFPQKYINDFSRQGINIHNPKFGTWWKTSSHLKNARGYNAAWESFLKTNPNQSQMFNYGRQLMGQYGIPVGF